MAALPHARTLAPDFAARLLAALPRLLTTPGALPDDWDPHATTYDLPRFHSDATFATLFDAALTRIVTENIVDAGALRNVLQACGLPYDYARLGQPLSTVYELLLQAQTHAAYAMSFASVTKPWLSVIEAPDRSRPVRVVARGALPLSAEAKAQLVARGVSLSENHRGPVPPAPDHLTVLVESDRWPGATQALPVGIDALTYPVSHGGVLLVRDASRIPSHGIQVIRKRTVSALLATDAHNELARAAGVALVAWPSADATACDARLRALFPAITDTLYCCTGLAAEAAVFAAACELAGPKPVTFFYAQNGYGGTGQLITDVLTKATGLEPAPLPVMGVDAHGQPITLIDGIIARLATSAGGPACVFVETPTNPELQVHDFDKLMACLRNYAARTGHRVPILVDTTFAPLYPIMQFAYANEWPVVLVKSGSKYFTKGKTTLGIAAAAGDPTARAIVRRARAHALDADALARPAQLFDLANGLADLRPRMAAIRAHTLAIAHALRQTFAARGLDLTLYAMTEAQASAGLDCGIISFYLPPAPTTYSDLVDEFVAYLLSAAPELVKSRVSYGQSTGSGRPDYFYVINPQESTQGSLSLAVKESQKRNNVQICRISVPEHADTRGLLAAMEPFFTTKYGDRKP